MLDRIISIPSPHQDDAALSRPQALLAQQALDEQMALRPHHHHGKGGMARHRHAGPPNRIHHAPKPLMRHVTRQLAQTLPTQLPIPHRGGHRMMLMMGRLAQTHPHQAAAILKALNALSPTVLQTMLQTLASLPKAATLAMMALATQYPTQMLASLMTTLATLPPVVVAGLLVALKNGDLDALHHWLQDTPEATQQAILDLYEQCHGSHHEPTTADDERPMDDEEEGRRRLQDGWARWAALLHDLYPPSA